MRILIATDDVVGGGTAQVARHLAEGLKDFFEVRFCIADVPGARPCIDALEAHGIRNHPLDASTDDWLTSTYDINSASQVLREASPDLLISCGSNILHSHLALKRVAASIRLPFVSIINGYYGDYRSRLKGPLRTWAEEAAACAARNMFVANAAKVSCEADFLELGDRSVVITNACREEFFAPRNGARRRAIRSRLRLRDDELLLLCPARIQREKGQHLIVRALRRLGPGAAKRKLRFVFAGHSMHRQGERLQREAKEQGDRDRFVFLPHTSRLAELFDAADACILPSFMEGMPLVVCEAMAKGLPVIATDVGDVGRFLSEDCGILLPSPVDREEEVVALLSDTFDSIARSPAEFLARGRHGRTVALRHFHPMGMLTRYKDVLLDVMIERRQIEVDWQQLRTRVFLMGANERLALDRAISFNIVRAGWSRPHPGGRWIGQDPADLRILLKPGFQPRWLEIVFTPYLDESLTGNSLMVSANGGARSVFEVSDQRRRTATVDLAGLERTAALDVRLEAARSAMPPVADRDRRAPAQHRAFFIHEVMIR